MTTWTKSNENEYWEVVRRCLIDLHHFKPSDADERLTSFRHKLQWKKLDGDPLIYHNEPYNLACDLAGQQLDFDPGTSDAYFSIVAEVASD